MGRRGLEEGVHQCLGQQVEEHRGPIVSEFFFGAGLLGYPSPYHDRGEECSFLCRGRGLALQSEQNEYDHEALVLSHQLN